MGEPGQDGRKAKRKCGQVASREGAGEDECSHWGQGSRILVYRVTANCIYEAYDFIPIILRILSTFPVPRTQESREEAETCSNKNDFVGEQV